MNALRFSGAFSAEELRVAAKSLSKFRFQFWRPRGKLLELAVRLSIEKDVTVYDACYVALAALRGCKVITEDGELLEKFPDFSTPLSDGPHFLPAGRPG